MLKILWHMSGGALRLTQASLSIKMTMPSWLVIFLPGHMDLCSFPWSLRKVAEPDAAMFPLPCLHHVDLALFHSWNAS